MRILHKYILREIIGSFALGVLLLAVVFGMGQLRQFGDAMASSGMSVWDVVALFVLVMPKVAQYFVPVSFLVAILLAFGRMSRDGEVLAARACGLHLSVLTRPVLALSVVLAVGMFFCADRAAPWSLLKAESLVENLVIRAGAKILQPGRWVEGSNGLQFYVERVDEDGALYNVEIDYSNEDQAPVHVMARTGRITSAKEETVLVLEDCEIIASGQMAKTSVERAEVRLTKAFAALRESQEPIYRRDEDTLTLMELFAQLRHPQTSERRSRKARSAAGERIAMPFACIALALVGTSLGARALGGGRPYAVGMALPTVGVYYALMLVGQGISDVTPLSPIITCWLPNVVVGGAGVAMARRAANR